MSKLFNHWRRAAVTVGILGGMAAAALIPGSTLLGASTLFSHGDPTDMEQFMMELINRARADPAAEASRFQIDLNEGLAESTLSATPRQPLAFNADLLEAARAHSQWMLTQGQLSHVGQDGSSPGDRMAAAGYIFSGSWTYGENIGWKGKSGSLDVERTVAGCHEGLFVDEGIEGRGHRLNLLNDEFCEAGLGILTGPFDYDGESLNVVMLTEDFARSGAYPGPFLVGVIYQDKDHDGFYSPGEGLSGITIKPNQGAYYAVSSGSGGYAIPLTGLTGTLPVTVSGGVWPVAVTKNVSLAGRNVKLDFEATADLPVPPLVIKLTQPRVLSTGSPRFAIEGPVGQEVVIQRSSNLITWTDVRSLVLSSASVTFTDNTPPVPRIVYYRALAR